MHYHVRNRTLTLGKTRCRRCEKGTVAARKDCRTCRGTGNGPRGGRRGCQTCHGSGDSWDHEDRRVCQNCHGDWRHAEPETWTDAVPKELLELIPLRVERVDRANSWNENFLGMGTVYSCQDYGRAALTDDETMQKVVRHHLLRNRVQACKVTTGNRSDKVRKVARALVITVTSDGYAVRADI
jgi:hypothetical protein